MDKFAKILLKTQFFNNVLATKVQTRTLKKTRNQHHELVIASNSGIFFTLASLKKHSSKFHPSVKLVMPEFWLDSVHKDYDNLDWGQRPCALPSNVRKEFLDIFPDHGNNKLIKWGQIKELRNYCIGQLKKFNNVELYTGKPTIHRTGNIYQITTNERKFSMPVDDTLVYSSFREPDIEHGLGNHLPKISHVDLYKLGRNDIPKRVIISGNGRSLIWLAQHFPNTLFACIKPRDLDYRLLSNENLPKNIITYNLEDIKNNSLEVSYDPDKEEMLIYDKNNPANSFIGKFYCAIGLKRDPSITEMVPLNNLISYGNNIPNWIAPSEELPVGSLTEATMYWATLTENLEWASELFCYHQQNIHRGVFEKLEKSGIMLNDKFYDLLRQNILQLKQVPSLDEIIKIYQCSYAKSIKNSNGKNILLNLENDLKTIEKVLKGIEHENKHDDRDGFTP